MRGSSLLFIYIFFINRIKSSSKGDCYLKGIEDIHWLTAYTNDPVDDFEEKEFKRFAVNNIDDVEVFGDDYGKYVGAKLENHSLIIFPTLIFKSFEINENSTINPEMNVRLHLTCKTGARQLAFYQPIRDHNTYYPEFDQRSYTYILPIPLPGKFDVSTFGDTIVACDLDISNVRLDFVVNPTKDFSLFWDGPIDGTNKCHKAILKTNNPLRLISKTFYQIKVTDRGIPSRSRTAWLVVQINENYSIPPNPQFESAYYTASYSFENDKYNIIVDNPIRLKYGCRKIDFDLIEYKDNFLVDCESDEITVQLVTAPSDSELDNMVVMLVTIVATLEHAEKPGQTVLVINLPKRECPETETVVSTTACSSAAPPIECPVCPTQQTSYTCEPCNTECPFTLTDCPPCSSSPTVDCKTLPSMDYSPCFIKSERQSAVFIKFKQDSYTFKVESSYQGFLGIVTANAVPKEDIEYSIQKGKAFIKIDKNTGTLKIIKNVVIGIYNLIVYAEGASSKNTARTNVTITVVKNSDKLEAMTSVLIEHVVENENRFINCPCQCNDCTYKIIEQYPETDPKLFGVYNKTQIYAVPIDREMDEIIDMKIPQFMLRLVLTATSGCSKKNSNNMPLRNNSFNNNNKNFREWAFIPAKVLYAPDEMLTLIIIDDANDNPPVFEAGVKLVIGYPVTSLARLIAPLYLTKVTATDLDAGENALIRYSTDSTHFIAHPLTGIVYAAGDAVSDDSSNWTFNIIATDRNGAADGLSTYLLVEVKPLMQNHLIILTVNNMMLEELDGILEKLSNKTDMQIKYLTATFIPVTYTARWSGSFIRIILYGLNARNEPVEAKCLESAIEESYDSKNFTVDTPNFGTLSTTKNDDKSFNKGILLAAVVILSMLLVVFINILIALYYFKTCLAKKPCSVREAKATSSTSSNKSKNRRI